jgi:hypothetical protein
MKRGRTVLERNFEKRSIRTEASEEKIEDDANQSSHCGGGGVKAGAERGGRTAVEDCGVGPKNENFDCG